MGMDDQGVFIPGKVGGDPVDPGYQNAAAPQCSLMLALTGVSPSSLRATIPILTAPAVWELEGPIMTGPMISNSFMQKFRGGKIFNRDRYAKDTTLFRSLLAVFGQCPCFLRDGLCAMVFCRFFDGVARTGSRKRVISDCPYGVFRIAVSWRCKGWSEGPFLIDDHE